MTDTSLGLSGEGSMFQDWLSPVFCFAGVTVFELELELIGGQSKADYPEWYRSLR